MAHLFVSLEAHREGSDGPLRVVGIEVEEGGRVAPNLSIQDVSNAFANALQDHVTDFAYSISFIVPSNATGSEPVFVALEAYGLARRDVIAAILECLAPGPNVQHDISGLARASLASNS